MNLDNSIAKLGSMKINESNQGIVEIEVAGMDCAECVVNVQKSLENIPGVSEADVFLATERAVLHLEQGSIETETIQKALKNAGYDLKERATEPATIKSGADFGQQITLVTAVVFISVILIVIVGEFLGLFELLTAIIPFFIGLILVILAGWPIFLNVARATIQKRIISHTLMSVGVIAALIVGQWVTALLVVFFMRIGVYIESLTTERARYAVKQLLSLAPQTARVIRSEEECLVPIEEVQSGDIVLVRPGEKIAVDGVVVDGYATIDQSAITGESMPLEAGPGTSVYAATIAMLGSIQIEATHIGPESAYGRILKLLQQAEANRAEVQRFADRFSAYFLPLVGLIAILTLLIRKDPMAAVAVLVVACSCAIALATPIAVLASIGAGAKKGLLIKGGKYLETLDKADVLLLDKTGTLTFGKPQITDVVSLGAYDEKELLKMAASAERYSEHPIAEAFREAAREAGSRLETPSYFKAVPGLGIQATVGAHEISVGRFLLEGTDQTVLVQELEEEGKTVIFIVEQGELLGLIAISDKLRMGVPLALSQVKDSGIQKIELLTGDSATTAAEIARQLQIPFQAKLMPEDKIEVVRQYQQAGHVVIMIGDGINDAPALAQADIGIVMASVGSDIAVEAADISLLREDWALLPELLEISHRTMRVVRMNLGFTGIYNLLGLTLAALGLLPPIFAAAAQSLPDLVIMANSSRLLKQ